MLTLAFEGSDSKEQLDWLKTRLESTMQKIQDAVVELVKRELNIINELEGSVKLSEEDDETVRNDLITIIKSIESRIQAMKDKARVAHGENLPAEVEERISNAETMMRLIKDHFESRLKELNA